MIFLAAGKKMEQQTLKNFEKHGPPKGSTIVMTSTAYITDKAWAQVAPSLAKGIQAMPVICGHPNWWVVLTLDGFSSHVNVSSALEVIAQHKIFAVKEEGYTCRKSAIQSICCQASKTSLRSGSCLTQSGTSLELSLNGTSLQSAARHYKIWQMMHGPVLARKLSCIPVFVYHLMTGSGGLMGTWRPVRDFSGQEVKACLMQCLHCRRTCLLSLVMSYSTLLTNFLLLCCLGIPCGERQTFGSFLNFPLLKTF